MRDASDRPEFSSAQGGRSLPPRWLLEDLSRPAVTEIGGVGLTTPARLFIGWLRQMVQGILQEELRCPVRLEPASPEETETARSEKVSGEEARVPVFGIHMRLAGGSEENEALVTLDEGAARNLVDPLEEQLSGLQRVGGLTHSELGLLEYLSLTCLKRVLSTDSADSEHRDMELDNFTIRGFLHEREIRALLAGDDLSPVHFRVIVAGRAGTITLWLPRNPEHYLCSWSLDTLPAPAAVSPPTGRVSVRLALPPVVITRAELGGLQPKDVILLGVTTLESFATACSLVTGTGWRLSEAGISNDTPTTTAVRCGPLHPQVMSWPPLAEGETLLQPFLGAAELTIRQLEAWEDGGTLDLPKSSEAPVSLYERGVYLGTGELVRVQEELGIRLLYGELTI